MGLLGQQLLDANAIGKVLRAMYVRSFVSSVEATMSQLKTNLQLWSLT